MRYPELVIMRALIADPAVGRHIGFNVYPLIVPQSVAFPFVTYQRSGVERLVTLSTAPGIPNTKLDLRLFAKTYSQSREIADAIRSALDHYDKTVLGVSVYQVSISGESEDLVALEGGDMPPAWQTSFSLDIQWKEVPDA